MEVTRVVSACLVLLMLTQSLLATPLRSEDSEVEQLGDDLTDLVQDIVRVIRDAEEETDETETDDSSQGRRVRRYIHFSIGNDHKHLHIPRRHRIHHDRRRARGPRIVRV